MFSFIKKLFGAPSEDLTGLLARGAVVVDVRTKSEFASGHVKGSKNIPLDEIQSQTGKLKKHAHIILCCRSGSRSSMAMRLLQSKGFTNVTNGGSWQNVNLYSR
jgi:phage shock protein E